MGQQINRRAVSFPDGTILFDDGFGFGTEHLQTQPNLISIQFSELSYPILLFQPHFLLSYILILYVTKKNYETSQLRDSFLLYNNIVKLLFRKNIEFWNTFLRHVRWRSRSLESFQLFLRLNHFKIKVDIIFGTIFF
jgi:hypothetical protein